MSSIKTGVSTHLEIEPIRSLFNKRVINYSFAYYENGIPIIKNLMIDANAMMSLLNCFFSLQCSIQNDLDHCEFIQANRVADCEFHIRRFEEESNVIFSINDIATFRIDNSYVGRIFTSLESIFLESIGENESDLM